MASRLAVLGGALLVACGALAWVGWREYRTRHDPAPVVGAPPRKWVALEGVVVSPAGEPATQALGMVKTPRSKWPYALAVDAQGHFTCIEPERIGSVVTFTQPPDLVAGPWTIENDAPIRLQLLAAPHRLTGHVTDEHDLPLVHARVRVTDQEGHSFGTTTDATGAYSLGTVAEGGWVVAAAAETLAVSSTYHTFDGGAPVDLRLPLAGQVTVTSKGTDLSVTPPLDPSLLFGTSYVATDQRAIGPLPAGPRTIWASDEKQVGHQDVEVREGETLNVAIALSPGASVSGRVVSADGAPLDGAFVSVETPVRRQVQSNGDGFYRIDGLAPVRTVVWAQRPGFRTTKHEVDAVAGAMSSLSITMDPGD